MSNIKCIVISGKANSGKTTTILALIKKYSEKYTLVDYGSFSDHNRETNDKWAIFEINKKRVGLFSQGDGPKGIEHGLRVTKDCDLVIGASHLYGKTVKTYFNYKNRNFRTEEVIFINKVHFEENSYLEENKKFLLTIKELINSFL